MSPRRPSGTVLPAALLPLVTVTVVVGGSYVVLDVVLGRHAGPGPATAVATAVSALLAVPAYLGGRRLTERLAGESRPAGYRVLAELAALPPPTTRAGPDLGMVVEAVARGVGAGTCTLTVRRPGLRDRVVTWPRPGAESLPTRVEVPVRHGGEDVGTLAVDRVTVPGSAAERRRLLEAVASSLGVVLQATRSGIELERQLRAALAHATEIAAARRRAVAESDNERRRIERDLHDGAQHHLVTLSLALGLVEHDLTTGRLDAARSGLAQLAAQTDAVEELLARTTAGVTSRALAENGLVTALRAELAHDEPPIALDVPPLPDLPGDVAAAVYFCCLEAVNNARKHAPGAAVGVRITVEGERLRFTVQDDGPGWDMAASAASPGRGLRNVTTRLAAVGGQVEVRSAPGRGTAVEGAVPLPGVVAVRPTAGTPAGQGLLEQVRALVRSARDAFHGTPEADRLQALAGCLDEPLRIAVTGQDGAPAAGLLRVLAAEPSAAVRYLGDDEPHAPDLPARTPADAYVLVLDGTRPDDGKLFLRLPGRVRPSQTVGVLVGEAPAPGLHRLCQAVVTVPLGTPDGLTSVRDLVATRLAARAGAIKARTVLATLETALRDAPDRGATGSLLYRLDEIRSGAHELAELDLLDALWSGQLSVPEQQRRAAERLLGAEGVDAAARLGCAPGAGPADVARAAAEHLAAWQRTAAHPASSAATRHLAAALVGTCERLLAGSAVPV